MKRILSFCVCLILAGCSTVSQDMEATAMPTIVPDTGATATGELLAEVRWSGGMCLNKDGGRVCETILLIDDTGTYTLTGNIEEPKVLELDDAELAEFKANIAQTDFEEILNTPFTDTCPRAFDGPAPIYTFYTADRDITMDTCEVTVDQTVAPFSTIEQLQQRAWEQ